MKSVDEMKKMAKGRTSMVVFAIIVVDGVIYNWMT